jgi:hypothetical protein
MTGSGAVIVTVFSRTGRTDFLIDPSREPLEEAGDSTKVRRRDAIAFGSVPGRRHFLFTS